MPHHVVVKSLSFTSALGRTKPVSHFKHIVDHDRSRAQKFLAGLHPHGPSPYVEARKSRRGHHHHHRHHPTGGSGTVPPSGGSASDSIDVTDSAVTYLMDVTIGGQDFNLLIDTGSSNTWCGADTQFEPNSSVESTREAVNVSYGSGSFSGTEFTGPVVLGGSSGLTISNQSFGVASTSQGFSDTDGILGIGPVDLTQGTVFGTSEVPTVTDNLFNNGTISTESIGISYNPTTGQDIANGELTFGGVDQSKITGDVTFVDITSTSPASNYWGIDQTITYGSSGSAILNSTAGIVDTGTTLLLIATDAFQAYQQATQATLDQTTGLLKLSSSEFANLQSLFFQIGDTTFEFTANAQIWPRSMNSVLGGDDDSIYLIVSDLGSDSGSGLDFINGFGWLQRFYSVFDTTNSRVGIATTPNTNAETN
ncbi:putative aspartic protease [Lentinula aciculospora]|uniref:Aspartic protease n=1 Tax=Lentinula aciculospora TaxID=153920 RepID=A0A9W9AGP3_9AGAR|nr:putative aspartic protease [Lentinula aciculospora]